MANQEFFEIIVDDDISGLRLDKYLQNRMPDFSRSFIQNLIKKGNIKVNNRNIYRPNNRIEQGDVISVYIPAHTINKILPENIELDIVYEDSDIIIINKNKGMVVHPAPGHYSGTLVNALLYKNIELSDVNGDIRPGIVHRLDKDTSGLLIVAKNNEAHRNLSMQLNKRTLERLYLTIVENNIKDDFGVIDAPIMRHPVNRKKMAVLNEKNAREAITYYTVKERFGNFTLLEVKLETGRTHQIRVHMSYINHPIVGDYTYGLKKQKFKLKGQALHAYKLKFKHPITNEELLFESSPPKEFLDLLNKLRESNNFI